MSKIGLHKKPYPAQKKATETAYYAAIDLGTNSCRLVIATPTPTSFRVVETFSKITRLGEGIIKDNELSKAAMWRTVNTLRVCRSVMSEYEPIVRSRFVATAACRRAKNIDEFLSAVQKEADINLEIISSKEEARLAVVGCVPLLNRHIRRALIFDIGGGSTEISLARVTEEGKAFIEGYVSLPYGVVTISEAFPKQEMTNLAYNTIMERTHDILAEFDEKYHVFEAIQNQEIQVIGTSGTVTVLGAVHLGLPRYNRSAVDGLSILRTDIEYVINKIKNMGDVGRRKHRCIGPSKADLTISGCAIIEALMTSFPIAEITIADRGIREGILLDMMHSQKQAKKPFKKHFKKYPYFKRKKHTIGKTTENQGVPSWQN